MVEDRTDETPDSSQVTDEQVDPSTTDTELTEATEQQAVQTEKVKEPPFHEHPRWKEVQQEKEYWRSTAQNLIDKFQQPNAPVATQQEADIIQKYGAQDPATREFLRDLNSQMRREATKVGQEMAAPIIRENEVLKRTVASMQEKFFRQENKDVDANSQEEQEIAQLISMGVPLEKATWAVMGPKRVEGAKTGRQQTQKVKTIAKVNANLERTSIPQSSGLPQNRNENFREKADRIFREGGL